ncbi:response regulator [Corallincola platygyrae]|uniref:histidine kinase n=1 Tax=Corallincola platygyrae TaxID=1193278 RepID=A0ABW4XS38_9GAMM
MFKANKAISRHFIECIGIVMVLVLSLCSLPTSADSDTSTELTEGSNLTVTDLQTIAIELKYLDEVLTSSVLSYAFTGDPKWLTRYTENEPHLDTIIKQLLANPKKQNTQIIKRIDGANNALVEMEKRAISLVQSEQHQAAMALINSAEYRKYKAQYMNSLLEYIAALEAAARYKQEENQLNSDILRFSEEEKAWIENNVVRIGVEHWPPIVFIDNGQVAGLAGTLLQELSKRSGLEFEIVSGEWNTLLSEFNQGNIELLPVTYYSEEREENGFFSAPYFKIRELFYVLDERVDLQSNDDLSFARVAIPQGYITNTKVAQSYPNIEIVSTEHIEESINLLTTGEVDAIIDAELIIEDRIKAREIVGIRALDEDAIPPSLIHLYSVKTEPILHQILQKSIASISAVDLLETQQDWIRPPEENANAGQQTGVLELEPIWIIAALVVALTIFGAAITRLTLGADEYKFAARFGSKKFKYFALAILVILSILLFAIANNYVQRVKAKTFDSIEYNLTSLITSTQQRLNSWVEDEISTLEIIARSPKMVAITEDLLATPKDKSSLVNAMAQRDARRFFEEIQDNFGRMGFFIISPEMISLASKRDTNVGTINFISQRRPELLERVLNGESVFIPPIRSDVALESRSDKNPPTMFFASPVTKQGEVIAILTKRINPEGKFSQVLSAGFTGKSGETYAIDKQGLLLSRLRFTQQVRDLGLIEAGKDPVLNLRIADPGTELSKSQADFSEQANWPLTKMAKELTKFINGTDLNGYRDYRGVMVVGSWQWDHKLSLGLVTEVDVAESFEQFALFETTVYGILSAALFLIFGSTLFTLALGKRATQALSRSQAELEVLVEERTHELKHTSARTQSIIENASDGIVVVDSEGEIIEFSPSAETIFGYSAKEAKGQPLTLLMDAPFHLPNSPAGTQPQPDSTLHDSVVETVGVRKNGQQFDMEVAISHSQLGDSEIHTGMIRDITARKEAERELTMAKEAAEEATRAKSDFLANMSHEIRTPMNAIIGISYLALQTDLNRKQKDYVNKIHGSANSLLGIINDILDFSKIEAGKMELEQAPFFLQDTIDQVVQIISVKSKEKGLELLIDLAPELPLNLIGDSLRLGQVLINLANNAIKFTEQGEIIIRIAPLSSDDDSTMLQFSVQDTGIGMTQEQMAKLFQSFSQADASTTRTHGGTGLGLAICKSLAELMQGEIWVESEHGKGSTFYFTAQFGLSEQHEKAVAYQIADLSEMPMLIVDDSAAAREILYAMATEIGLHADLASSAEEAIEKIRLADTKQTPYQLVLADWKMPTMDGVEMVRTLQQYEALARPPKVIMITAFDRDEMQEEARDLVLDGSLTKPITVSTLLDSIMYAFGREGATAPAQQEHKLDPDAVAPIRGANILLVEDNDINQQIAVELLELVGLRVNVSDNGQIALDMLAQADYDAVLMDVQMPVMDGYAATRIIRENPKYQSLPIIAMTANAMSGDREKCLAAGMNDHLAKPIEPNEVFTALLKWVKQRDFDTSGLDKQSEGGDKSETPTDVPDLPGFDTESALARMAGSVNTYVKMLQRFIETEQDSIERIETEIEQSDTQTAERTSHTLKGLAGNIGAEQLAKAASELEQALRESNEREESEPTELLRKVNPLLENAKKVLNSTIETITKALESVQDNADRDAVLADNAPIDSEQLTSLLQQLANEIENYELTANETCDLIVSALENGPLKSEARELQKFVEGYDYDEAQTALNKLVSRLE